jgi:glycosyltransferase involved in cell wall biosynthesis
VAEHTRASPESIRPLRVVIDGAALSRPATGVARWVLGLSRAVGRAADVESRLVAGPKHLRGGGRLHRIPNLLRERWWYEQGINAVARQQPAHAMLMPANLSARPGPIPQVVTILDVNFLMQPKTYERTFVRYATWAYRRSIRDADRLTTISESSRTQISQHFDVDPTQIEVIYPGLDPLPIDRGEAASPRDRPYALYVGATERHKNVGLLIDAWRDRSPADLDLAIVGQPGREHSEILRRAATSAGRVIVVGRVSAAELECWYRHASVFVFPSKAEGFGFPPLEAMQRGIPVVASSTGSLPEVLGDGALYFDPEDRSALIDRISGLMEDDGGRLQLVQRGSDVAGRYTWETTARSMLIALRQVVANNR